MSAISRSLLNAVVNLLEWEELGSCQSEDELCTALMGSFLRVRGADPSLVLLREEAPPSGFDKILDLRMVPAWPPRAPAVAMGEVKFFPRGQARDYRTRLGARLSDLHYIESLSRQCTTFFLDVVLDRDLVGAQCYESLKEMCRAAARCLYETKPAIGPADLKKQEGIKAFAAASADRTPRKLLKRTKYGFLFPPMDLPGGSGRAKRGPAFVRKPTRETDDLIALGVRKAGKETVVPYRAFSTMDGVDAAVCLAVFEPGIGLRVTADHAVRALGRR